MGEMGLVLSVTPGQTVGLVTSIIAKIPVPKGHGLLTDCLFKLIKPR